jgi:hypothetical protein
MHRILFYDLNLDSSSILFIVVVFPFTFSTFYLFGS